MASVEQRIDRLERVLGSEHCICNPGHIPIVYVAPDWDKERIHREVEAARIVCPVHGEQRRPLVLSEACRNL